jgi:hypothetical protein
MKNYVGRKCKGFRFESGTDHTHWVSSMESYIGEIGYIKEQHIDCVIVDFKTTLICYPISLIEEHLIPETPEIPQLGEGVNMEVSNTGIEWFIERVIAKRHDGLFISHYGDFWQYARPIQEVKKYTKEELVKILGHDFEIV